MIAANIVSVLLLEDLLSFVAVEGEYLRCLQDPTVVTERHTGYTERSQINGSVMVNL